MLGLGPGDLLTSADFNTRFRELITRQEGYVQQLENIYINLICGLVLPFNPINMDPLDSFPYWMKVIVTSNNNGQGFVCDQNDVRFDESLKKFIIACQTAVKTNNNFVGEPEVTTAQVLLLTVDIDCKITNNKTGTITNNNVNYTYTYTTNYASIQNAVETISLNNNSILLWNEGEGHYQWIDYSQPEVQFRYKTMDPKNSPKYNPPGGPKGDPSGRTFAPRPSSNPLLTGTKNNNVLCAKSPGIYSINVARLFNNNNLDDLLNKVDIICELLKEEACVNQDVEVALLQAAKTQTFTELMNFEPTYQKYVLDDQIGNALCFNLPTLMTDDAFSKLVCSSASTLDRWIVSSNTMDSLLTTAKDDAILGDCYPTVKIYSNDPKIVNINVISSFYPIDF